MWPETLAEGDVTFQFEVAGKAFKLLIRHHGGIPITIWEYEINQGERRFIFMSTDDDERMMVRDLLKRGEKRARELWLLAHDLGQTHKGLRILFGYTYKNKRPEFSVMQD